MNFAILGAGNIAEIMAKTINKMEGITAYAVASREKSKAMEFSNKYKFLKAYGDYDDMLKDSNIDLVYIATPHSLHYEHVKKCIEYGKNVLCEKAFMVNATQAMEIFESAKKKKVFVTEAIWTRYMPSRDMILQLINSGCIGEVTSLTANLCYSLSGKERMEEPYLAGGALLDLGVYTINFALMCFGDDIKKITSDAIITNKGVDASNSITITFMNEKMAVLHSSFKARSDRKGVLYGTKGYMEVDNINNCQKITIYNLNDEVLEVHNVPDQITGYEYEVQACKESINAGLLSCSQMPHEETIYVMKIMDEIRKSWGMKYPCE